MSTTEYPKAIFYDSKTTIFDWEYQWRTATGRILEKYVADVGIQEFQGRWMDYMRGYYLQAAFFEYRNLNRCIEDALDDTFRYFGIDGERPDVEYFIELYDEVQPFPEASEALKRQQSSTEIWTFSNVERDYLDAMVDNLDIEPDFVGTMEDAGYIKPSPYAYRWVLEENDCTADEVLYCAAPIFDVNGSMAFGMKCAYLNRPEQTWREPQKEAHYVISDLMELTEMLENGSISAPGRIAAGTRAE